MGAHADDPPGRMSLAATLASDHPTIPLSGAEAVVRLAAEGATLPFIARYRKEQTGNLDEVAIQAVLDTKERWDALVARREFILREIERQEKLSPELREQILATTDREALEDLYLPYKRKRATRAAVAREAGLGPLADWIWDCGHGLETPQPGQTLELWAFTFRNEERGFPDTETVIQGAQDILVERLAEMPALRALVRQEMQTKGWLSSTRTDKAKPNGKYEKYFAHAEPVTALLEPRHSHRYLAIRRGAAEGELTIQVSGGPTDPEFEARQLGAFEAAACTVPDSPGAAVLGRAALAALREHVQPSVATAVSKALKMVADDAAVAVFAENVSKVLLAAPLGPHPVLGADPGLRTGCKLAVVDAAGGLVSNGVIQLGTDAGKEEALGILAELARTHGVRAVAVGNGTAGRETERFIRSALGAQGCTVPVVMVSEAGANAYSASEVARQEFPDLDVTVRGTISIARRLQDPLAELVKIDPKSIGVGQYQHDVPPALLKRSLEQVVDSCVNQVGVNLNTASVHLLAHVAGLGSTLASAVVEHRTAHGLFRSRAELLQVPHFSLRTFEQAAGFLRIPDGEHPLDNTGVHPERYEALARFAESAGTDVAGLLGPGAERVRQSGELRDELGEFTFADVLQELEKPGRDPRETFVPFQFRDDVHTLEDLKPGMVCSGIVTNVTTFGAFVDVGVHQDGLVHVSRLADRFVQDPHEVVSPGDRVQVRVVEVNRDKAQIALTMKRDRPPERRPRPTEAKPAAERPRRPRERGRERERERRRGDGRESPQPPPRREKPGPAPAFNNPFAALSSLRDSLKPKP